MKLRAGHIVLGILAMLVWVSCQQGPRRIPQKKMVDICIDMFLQDQYIRLDPSLRKQADTTLVYEGIFEKYGYDTDDYRYSVEYYLRDPERMSKIMNEVAARMNQQARDMNEVVEFYDWREGLMELYGKPASEKLPKVVPMSDTLRIERDSDTSITFFRYRRNREVQEEKVSVVKDTAVVGTKHPKFDINNEKIRRQIPL